MLRRSEIKPTSVGHFKPFKVVKGGLQKVQTGTVKLVEKFRSYDITSQATFVFVCFHIVRSLLETINYCITPDKVAYKINKLKKTIDKAYDYYCQRKLSSFDSDESRMALEDLLAQVDSLKTQIDNLASGLSSSQNSKTNEAKYEAINLAWDGVYQKLKSLHTAGNDKHDNSNDKDSAEDKDDNSSTSKDKEINQADKAKKDTTWIDVWPVMLRPVFGLVALIVAMCKQEKQKDHQIDILRKSIADKKFDLKEKPDDLVIQKAIDADIKKLKKLKAEIRQNPHERYLFKKIWCFNLLI